jgi:hypothetical protein
MADEVDLETQLLASSDLKQISLRALKRVLVPLRDRIQKCIGVATEYQHDEPHEYEYEQPTLDAAGKFLKDLGEIGEDLLREIRSWEATSPANPQYHPRIDSERLRKRRRHRALLVVVVTMRPR